MTIMGSTLARTTLTAATSLLFAAGAFAAAPSPRTAPLSVHAEDEESGGDSPDNAKDDAKTEFVDGTLADTSWEGDYLEDVAGVMKPGKIGQTKTSFALSSYDLGYKGDGKKIKRCTVTVTVSVGLATWNNYGKRKTADAEWDRFIAALKEHENGHVKIAKDDLADMASVAIGKSLEDAQKALAAELAKSTANQDAYDTKTKHGETQKAVLDGNKDKRPEEKGQTEEPGEDAP